jgi:hypothetical protein
MRRIAATETAQTSTNDPVALAGVELQVPSLGAGVMAFENVTANVVMLHYTLYFVDDEGTETAATAVPVNDVIQLNTGVSTFDTRLIAAAEFASRVTFRIESKTDGDHGSVKLLGGVELYKDEINRQVTHSIVHSG